MSLNCPWAVHIPWLHWGHTWIHCTPCTQGWVVCAWFTPRLRHFWLFLSVDPLRFHLWNHFLPLAPSDFWPGLFPLLQHPTPMPGTYQWKYLLLHKAWLICFIWETFSRSGLFLIPWHVPTSLDGCLELIVMPWIVCPPHWVHVDYLLASWVNFWYILPFSSGLMVRFNPWLVPLFLQVKSWFRHSGFRGTRAVKVVLSQLRHWLFMRLPLLLFTPVACCASLWSMFAWPGPGYRFLPLSQFAPSWFLQC